MQVVYIVSVWPEPQTSGASTRVLQLIACLKTAGFKLTIASTASRSPLSAELETDGIKTASIRLNDSSFDDFIKEQQPDLVIFDKFMTEEQFGWRVAEHCPAALRVLDTIDLHCLRVARAESVKNNNQPLHLKNPTSLREVAAIYRCDLSLFVADYEIEVLARHFQLPEDLMYYYPLTVDDEKPDPFKRFEERSDFIAIGSFLHPPNWDQVLQLKQKIWPSIRKQLPQAKLNIVGSYPPAKALALHNSKEGFMMKGFVENDLAAMQQSRIHLAPLRFGAGIKSKCMLAFRAGTPSVTTAIGAEGLLPSENWAGRICMNESDFIDSAVHLYQTESSFNDAQINGARILTHFHSEKWNPLLIDMLNNLKEKLSSHREKNFTGQMLLHHQHLSTRYMSKWIEAKNNA